jgi:hypothetical protein
LQQFLLKAPREHSIQNKNKTSQDPLSPSSFYSFIGHRRAINLMSHTPPKPPNCLSSLSRLCCLLLSCLIFWNTVLSQEYSSALTNEVPSFSSPSSISDSHNKQLSIQVHYFLLEGTREGEVLNTHMGFFHCHTCSSKHRLEYTEGD